MSERVILVDLRIVIHRLYLEGTETGQFSIIIGNPKISVITKFSSPTILDKPCSR
jgi:hypothetical protein